MKPIQEINLASHKKRMLEAIKNNKEDVFNYEKDIATNTLKNIQGIDSTTYKKYSHLLEITFK